MTAPLSHPARRILTTLCSALLAIVLGGACSDAGSSARSSSVARPASGMAGTQPASLPTTRVVLSLRRSLQAEVPEKVTIELLRIPAGRISITGADGRAAEHEVKSIWMARYETTWVEYFAFAFGHDLTREEWIAKGQQDRYRGDRVGTPEEFPVAGWNVVGFPANNVTKLAAERYCAWLSKKTGRKFRLPTEAEWEYACRAGGPPVKLDEKALREVAWFEKNAEVQAHAVGQKRPNAWGLFDMLGNVGEHVIMPTGEETIAGGSYQDSADEVHSAAREAKTPKWSARDPQDPKDPFWYNYGGPAHIGFRVVMEE